MENAKFCKSFETIFKVNKRLKSYGFRCQIVFYKHFWTEVSQTEWGNTSPRNKKCRGGVEPAPP